MERTSFGKVIVWNNILGKECSRLSTSRYICSFIITSFTVEGQNDAARQLQHQLHLLNKVHTSCNNVLLKMKKIFLNECSQLPCTHSHHIVQTVFLNTAQTWNLAGLANLNATTKVEREKANRLIQNFWWKFSFSAGQLDLSHQFLFVAFSIYFWSGLWAIRSCLPYHGNNCILALPIHVLLLFPSHCFW